MRVLSLLVTAALAVACRSPGPRAAAASPPHAPLSTRLGGEGEAPTAHAWEVENPLRPLPAPPLGSGADFSLVPWVTPEKVRLGRWLFYDARLSADGTISCATCHRPEHGFSEPTPVSTGIGGQRGRRKAPPVLNAAFPLYPVWFWDGRAASLAEQAGGPIANPVEMGNTHGRMVETLSAVPGYAPHFREAFGDPRVDLARVQEAIAAYEATRLSGNSRFDRYDAGDATALEPEEIRGRELFFGRAQCSQCHLGPSLSDGKFHNLGVGWRPPPPLAPTLDGFADKGRYEVTKNPDDLGAFKTPTLRDVSKRAPYMHDGSIPDLWGAVLHYWRGGIRNPWLSERMVAVPLSRDDVAALVAFLEALDGEGYADVPPRSFPQ